MIHFSVEIGHPDSFFVLSSARCEMNDSVWKDDWKRISDDLFKLFEDAFLDAFGETIYYTPNPFKYMTDFIDNYCRLYFKWLDHNGSTTEFDDDWMCTRYNITYKKRKYEVILFVKHT